MDYSHDNLMKKAFNNSTYTFLSSDQYENNFDNNEVF